VIRKTKNTPLPPRDDDTSEPAAVESMEARAAHRAAPDEPRPRRMINEKEVLEIVRVGRSTLWGMVKAGKFPKPVHIATNRRMWFLDEVIAWQNSLRDAS
jgi:predicted DNA-binding transcriptional regulator AlpA